MSDDFEGRQVAIFHQQVWDRLVMWADGLGLRLDQIPNGLDENGLPIMNNPDDLPTYAFFPK